MTNLYNKFSLVDFLAYLLPGIYLLVVLAAWIPVIYGDSQLTIMLQVIKDLPSAVLIIGSTGVLGIAYLLGCLSSSFILELEPYLYDIADMTATKSRLSEKDAACERVSNILEKKFGIEGTDLDDAEYVGRSLVYEIAPACSQLIARQSSVRQLRRNCIFPTLFLAAAVFTLSGKNHSWGLIALGVFLLVVARQLLISALSNRMSEIRETFTALVAMSKNHGKDT